jgi:hypothetical protein
MARPRRARAAMSVATLGDRGARTDPTMKMTAPQRSVERLPMRSAMVPPMKAPSMAPIRTTLTTISSICVESPKEVRTKRRAAAMIPMSKP